MSDSRSDTKKEEKKKKWKIWLRCTDGVSIDGKAFATESMMVRDGYRFEHVEELNVNVNSDILNKVKDFCEMRSNIIVNNHDQNLLQHKLNDFNSQFLLQNRDHAFLLMTAALKLQMKSLLDLVMEEVVDFITQKTSEEICKLFFVNLEKYDVNNFEVMTELLFPSRWAFNKIIS